MKELNLSIEERSTSQKVAKTLRNAIFLEDLKLGERLVEANIAKMLNVSITPVREAFNQLSKEGLIQIIPYKGTYVLQITKQLIEEVYSIRLPLELMAVDLALPRITPDDCDLLEHYSEQMDLLTQAGKYMEFAEYDNKFHGLFYEKSEHKLLLEIWQMIQSRIQLLQTWGRSQNLDVNKGVVESRHLTIVNSIRQGDYQSVIQKMKEHIETGKIMVDKQFSGTLE